MQKTHIPTRLLTLLIISLVVIGSLWSVGQLCAADGDGAPAKGLAKPRSRTTRSDRAAKLLRGGR